MLKKLFLLIFLTMAVLQAAPQISWADMDVSFKAGWTNSGPQNYGTSSSVVLTLTSTGSCPDFNELASARQQAAFLGIPIRMGNKQTAEGMLMGVELSIPMDSSES